MPRHVTGIGGFFFRSDDHNALASWYNKPFGINDQGCRPAAPATSRWYNKHFGINDQVAPRCTRPIPRWYNKHFGINDQGCACHRLLHRGWYNKHFGINDQVNGWIWQQDAGPTVFSPFKRDTDYFGNDGQQFMLNLRVQDMDGLLKKLEADGVRIDPKRQDEDYGRFAWVYDPEGNKIELWEPT